MIVERVYRQPRSGIGRTALFGDAYGLVVANGRGEDQMDPVIVLDSAARGGADEMCVVDAEHRTDGRAQSGLLVHLPQHGVLGVLTVVDAPAGQRPMPRMVAVAGDPGQQDSIITNDSRVRGGALQLMVWFHTLTLRDFV